jgi:hypothetical protein
MERTNDDAVLLRGRVGEVRAGDGERFTVGERTFRRPSGPRRSGNQPAILARVCNAGLGILQPSNFRALVIRVGEQVAEDRVIQPELEGSYAIAFSTLQYQFGSS